MHRTAEPSQHKTLGFVPSVGRAARSLREALVGTTSDPAVAIRVFWMGDLSGKQPAVVWVHANGFTGRMWLPIIEALERIGCSEGASGHLLYDLRGQGLSSKPEASPQNYAWELQAEDLLSVLDWAGGRPVHAVGHSMGAAILVLAAAMRPESFSSIALFEPIVMIPDRLGDFRPEQNPLIAQALRRRSRFANRDEARARLGSKPPFSFWAPDALELYFDTGMIECPDGGVQLACPPEVEATNYLVGSQHDGFEKLEELEMPVLLMQGERSPKGGPLDTSALAERVPDARFEELPETTHFAPFERPDVFASTLRRFWADLENRHKHKN